MINEQTRNAVWQSLLDVARLVRYYEALSSHYMRYCVTIRLLLLTAATGGVAVLLNFLPGIVQIVTGALVAFLVALDFALDYGKKAAVSNTISIECSEIEIEWESLWFKLENISDHEALQENMLLLQRLTKVTGRTGYVGIIDNQKLNKKCTKAAYTAMKAEYATQ